MQANIVSILETIKGERVSIAELQPRSACKIVRFMKNDIEIGRTVRTLRERHKESLTLLADFLDMEKGALSKKERGVESSFNDDELDRIARRYGLRRWMIHALAEGCSERQIEFAESFGMLSPGTIDDIISIARGKKTREGAK